MRTQLAQLALIVGVSSGWAARAAPDTRIVAPTPIDMPLAELPPGTRPEPREVLLVLTIAPDGRVSDVVLQAGAGEPWDSAAISAARRFLFTPATLDGQPIAVTVPFAYVFEGPARRHRVSPDSRERRDPEVAPGFIFAGELVERGSRTPQAGVPVIVRDPRTGRTWEASSDESGHFEVFGLPRTGLSLDIFTRAFEPLAAELTPDSSDLEVAKSQRRRFHLTPSDESVYRTVVRDPRPPDAASVIDLTEDELTKVAGTFGDPTRVVATLPGVARSPFGFGYYAVRGAQPDNTGFFIDGHPALFLYHLLGGPGIIHPALVADLAFYPGGYPARHGRVASSAIAVTTRDPPRDRIHLDLELDVFRAGLMVSVPFDDRKGVATVSLRRSYYDLLLPLFTDEIDLAFTDYQVRLSYDFSPTVRARIVALGAVDSVSTRDAGDPGEGPSASDIGLGMHRVNAAVEVDLSRNARFTASLAFEHDFLDNERVADGDATIRSDGRFDMLHIPSYVRLREPDTRRGWQLDVGLDGLISSGVADLTIPSPPPFGDPRPPTFSPVIFQAKVNDVVWGIAPFVSADIPLARTLRLLPGLRLNLEHHGAGLSPTVDPRLAMRWELADGFTLKAMAAVAHQPPPVFQVAAPFGDPWLALLHADAHRAPTPSPRLGPRRARPDPRLEPRLDRPPRLRLVAGHPLSARDRQPLLPHCRFDL